MTIPSPVLRSKLAWIFSTTLIIFAGLGCLSFRISAVTTTIWNQLGISESTGIQNIRNSFIEGYVSTYGTSSLKKVAAGDRAAVAQDILQYSKGYINSDVFINEYQTSRMNARPQQPEAAKSKEAIQAERIATLQKSIDEGEKSMKTLPAELVASFSEVQQMLQDQIQDLKNPDSEMLNMLVEAEQFNHNNAVQQYNDQTAAWQLNYPEDCRMMVAGRLRKFLELTADVDFTAATREEMRLKKFVNPAYESKPVEWKMAYRAGQPVVDVSREFATAWLRELDQ